jgi:hypothetical protein
MPVVGFSVVVVELLVCIVRFLMHVVGFSVGAVGLPVCTVRFPMPIVGFSVGVVGFPVCIVRFSMAVIWLILFGTLIVATMLITLVNGMVPVSFSRMIALSRGVSDFFGSRISNFLDSGISKWRFIDMGALITMKSSMKIAADIHLISTDSLLLSIVAFIVLMTLVNVVSVTIPLVLLRLLILRSLKIEVGVSLGALIHRCQSGLNVGYRLILKRMIRWLNSLIT